ncbi:MAG: hypothetical protein ACTSV2_08330 [Candidatus Thorarchaeota archaeon]
MSDILGYEGQKEFIERNIIQAFGASLIEFEAVLYHKYLLLSGAASLTTEKTFRRILSNMHASGYVSPLEFQDKRCWKRLLIDEPESQELTPAQVKQILAEVKLKQKKSSKSFRDQRVSDSNQIAEEILTLIRDKLFRGRPLDKQSMRVLNDIVSGTRRALADSEEEFLKYVDEYIPSLRKHLELLLMSKGEDVLLLSLRKIESNQRDR